jgi:hypothetical protein
MCCGPLIYVFLEHSSDVCCSILVPADWLVHLLCFCPSAILFMTNSPTHIRGLATSMFTICHILFKLINWKIQNCSKQRPTRTTPLLTYLFTPWSRVYFEKLTGLQLVKKFPAFYRTRRFITAFTSARHLSLSWARSIQSIPPHPNSWRSTLILSSNLRLGLPNYFFAIHNSLVNVQRPSVSYWPSFNDSAVKPQIKPT